jgi:hypothetical protein
MNDLHRTWLAVPVQKIIVGPQPRAEKRRWIETGAGATAHLGSESFNACLQFATMMVREDSNRLDDSFRTITFKT